MISENFDDILSYNHLLNDTNLDGFLPAIIFRSKHIPLDLTGVSVRWNLCRLLHKVEELQYKISVAICSASEETLPADAQTFGRPLQKFFVARSYVIYFIWFGGDSWQQQFNTPGYWT